MTNLAEVVADFISENPPQSNSSNPSQINSVTVLDKENQHGNLSNLSNLRFLNNQSLLQMLNIAAQVSGLTAKQIWAFMDKSDIDDLRQGFICQSDLNTFASSWVRYPESVEICNHLPFPFESSTEDISIPFLNCNQCKHFEKDNTGDGSGIGKCLINAPASQKGLMWFE